MPRFLRFCDPPKVSDIVARVTRSLSVPLKLHLKTVSYLDFADLETLDIFGQYADEIRKFYLDSKRWLYDDTMYPQPQAHNRSMLSGKVKFCQSDWTEIGAAGRYASVESVEYGLIDDSTPTQRVQLDVLGSVNYFPTDEQEKERRRVLGEPLWNDIIGREHLKRFSQSSSTKIRNEVLRCKYTIQYDMASWYDQIKFLSPKVRVFFCLMMENRWHCLKQLPMGFRPACQIAQSITWMLCAFERNGVHISTMLDNVRLSSYSLDDLLQAAKMFEQRCEACGVQLNDAKLTTQERVKTVDTYCGVEYDYNMKTRCLGVKTQKKCKIALTTLDATYARSSFRQVAAVVSLCLYTAGVLAKNLMALTWSLRWYIEQMKRTLGFTRSAWDSNADEMPPVVRKELLTHLQFSVSNAPVPVVNVESEPDWTVITDASALGWSVISICMKSGRIMQHRGVWGPEHAHYDLRSSVTTESLCIAKAAEIIGAIPCVRSEGRNHVRVISDHAGAVFALERGYAWAAAYAYMLQVVVAAGLAISCRFVPGVLNAADGGSRHADGPDATNQEIEVCIGAAVRTEDMAGRQKKRSESEVWME